MITSIPTLPHPYLANGLNHIPPPKASSFEEEFAGILPPGNSIPSSWGTTRYYSFQPPAGIPNAPKVLLIHGGGTSAIGLAPLALKLSSIGFDVVAYDLYGHGLSSTPLETHTLSLMHHQILELLSHLNWSSGIHVLGFSIGGSIAASFVALHPHVARQGGSLTLVAPAGLWRKANRSWWARWSTDGGFGLEWLRRRTIMNFLLGGATPSPDWKEKLQKGEVDSAAVQLWEQRNHRGWEASLISMWNYGGVFDQHELFGLLPTSDVDALVILGEKDVVIVPEDTKEELEKLGWKGTIEIVKGAGHEIVRSHVKEVVALLEGFWVEKRDAN